MSQKIGTMQVLFKCAAVMRILLVNVFIILGKAAIAISKLNSGHKDGYSMCLPMVGTASPNSEDIDYDMPPVSQNPLILHATSPDGIVVDYIGSRSEDGLPITPGFVTTQKTTEDGSKNIEYVKHKPKRVIFGARGQLEFTWVSDSEIIIAVSTPDGHGASVSYHSTNPERSLLLAVQVIVSNQLPDQAMYLEHGVDLSVTKSMFAADQPIPSTQPIQVEITKWDEQSRGCEWRKSYGWSTWQGYCSPAARGRRPALSGQSACLWRCLNG